MDGPWSGTVPGPGADAALWTDADFAACRQIYVHIPGSEKLVLELPLVIGTAGLGSRSNSVSSQEGSVSSSSQSWVSLRMPSQPPSYCDISRDCRLDQPLTPLLDDFDGEDSPIFMNAPAFQFPPPPAYAEVDACSDEV